MKDNRGNTIKNPQLIANKFNEFFTNIGPFLAAKIPHSTVDHKSYLSGSFSDSFFWFTYYPWWNYQYSVLSEE